MFCFKTYNASRQHKTLASETKVCITKAVATCLFVSVSQRQIKGHIMVPCTCNGLCCKRNNELGTFTIKMINGSKSCYLISQTQSWEMARLKSSQGLASLTHIVRMCRDAQDPWQQFLTIKGGSKLLYIYIEWTAAHINVHALWILIATAICHSIILKTWIIWHFPSNITSQSRAVHE